MRKSIHILMGFVIWGLLAAVCVPGLEGRESGKPFRVVCTILPVYSLTLNVVGKTPGVQVDLLLPAHQGCPHNYDLTPGDLIKMTRADLIIANGFGMEEFLDQFLKQAGSKVPVILAAEKIQPILNRPEPAHSDHGKSRTGHRHDHADLMNGHAWVSPRAAAIMVRTIAEGLSLKDPAHARDYGLNAQEYSGRLEALFQEMQQVVLRARNKNILAFHDILSYLARDTGLTMVGVIQTQLGVEPSTKVLARLARKVKNHQVAAIFSEPQYSDKVAQTLSRETGVPVFEIDPVATGKAAADTYEKAMKKNLEIFRKAFK